MSKKIEGYKTIEDNNIDKNVAPIVNILRQNGVETFESCDGSPGHVFHDLTVRFHGGSSEGLKALSIVLEANLPVMNLRRYWNVFDKEITGPFWEITFQKGASVTKLS